MHRDAGTNASVIISNVVVSRDVAHIGVVHKKEAER